MVITWQTRNIWSLFPLKDKNDCKSCVIYKGECSCGSRYIGEIKRNAEARWNERNNPTKSSEQSKHLPSNINHYFTWAVISNALKIAKTRKHHLLLCGNLILMTKRTLKDWFYLEIMSHIAINDIMQTPKKEVFFFLLSLLYCFNIW